MPSISFDNPYYLITSVTHNRLPIFGTDELKRILAGAFTQARETSGMQVLAYVLMPDRYHVITDDRLKPADVIRYVNGISARKVINHLKQSGDEATLNELRVEEQSKDFRYSLWDTEPGTSSLTSSGLLVEMTDFVHQEPVVNGLVEDASEYTFSSVRYWQKKPLLADEPIVVDVKDLVGVLLDTPRVK